MNRKRLLWQHQNDCGGWGSVDNLRQAPVAQTPQRLTGKGCRQWDGTMTTLQADETKTTYPVSNKLRAMTTTNIPGRIVALARSKYSGLNFHADEGVLVEIEMPSQFKFVLVSVYIHSQTPLNYTEMFLFHLMLYCTEHVRTIVRDWPCDPNIFAHRRLYRLSLIHI